MAPFAYDLVLACDSNTHGHTQWFLYRVRNMRPEIAYQINIINMTKPDSLFCSGMRPLLYSERDAAPGRAAEAGAEAAVGWRRCGSAICYFQNQYTSQAHMHMCICTCAHAPVHFAGAYAKEHMH